MIIEYLDKVYLINYKNDTKKFFKYFINNSIFCGSLVRKFCYF